MSWEEMTSIRLCAGSITGKGIWGDRLFEYLTADIAAEKAARETDKIRNSLQELMDEGEL